MTFIIAAAAVAVILAIIVLAARAFLTASTGRHADKVVIDELNERVTYERTLPVEDTIAGNVAAQEWWRMRADIIQENIDRDVTYWQRVIDSGHLAKAWWLERERTA